MLVRHVLIAGAGLAGLTSAYELARAGVGVTVVEARARAGGRIWTVRDRFVDGAYGDLGAEFIDDDHHRLRALVRAFGIETVSVLRRGFTQRYHGDDGAFELSRTRGFEELRAAFAPLIRAYRIAGGNPDAPQVRDLSTFSVREWLRRTDAPRRVHAMADAMRGFFLADPEDLSALPLVAELGGGPSPAQTPVHRIVGGTDRLLDAMAKRTPARLLIGHQLRAIHHAPDRVIATVTDDRGLLQELESDAVVITLPASALRHVEITPVLPSAQDRAIRALRYGCATKVVVQTDVDTFGNARARAFATDTCVGAFWDASEGQASPSRVVSFLAGGSASGQLASRLRDGAGELLADLCWLRRPGASPRPRAYAAWTWEHDPFAGGGYAYLDPAFDPGWLPLLRQKAGRLFFAGEHTSEAHQGYMEGAVESAERVVREVTR